MKNYHTHTARCNHAYGKDRDYVKKAIKYGFTELGFSDHAPMIFTGKDYYSNFRMLPSEVEDYVNSVNLLRREYENEIKIFLGFELEYYPQFFDKTYEFLSQYNFDYLILGQHFIGNEYEPYSHYSNHATDSTVLFDKYICQSLEALNTGKFLYIAHPDLFNFTGSDEVYIEKMTYFCREIKKLGVPLEFNLLGFAQGRSYPDKRFWQIASEVGNDTVIGFDAHSPDVLANKKLYNDAVEYLSKLDITPIEISL